MAANLNFRTALSGFNREDVVHYIEYMNAKFNTQLNQLTGEAQELRDKLSALAEIPDLSEEVAKLKAQLEEAAQQQALLEQEKDRLAAERDAALAQIEQLKAEQADVSHRYLQHPRCGAASSHCWQRRILNKTFAHPTPCRVRIF